MSHTDPMILALRALGEAAGSGHDDEHELTCGPCRHELARFSQVVDLARTGGPVEQLEAPPPQVWDRIAAALGPAGSGPLEPADVSDGHRERVTAQGDQGAQGAQGSVTRAGRRAGMSWRRGPLAATVAGLAAGLIVGVAGTAGVVQLTKAPASRVVAQIALSPLPAFPQWNGVTGTAVMRVSAGQQVMAVTLHAPSRPGFYEVWLLGRNGVSMIALGDLDADHDGTFAVPPGVDLANYSRVDISLQPFDGSTLHVRSSVVRGSLPAAAALPSADQQFIRLADSSRSKDAVGSGVLQGRAKKPYREEADTLKTRLGKIVLSTAIGAGALGVGLGGSLAVASAATTHSTSVTSSTSSSSRAATTAVNAGSAVAAATPSSSASAKPTHNCQNMKGGAKGMPARSSTAS